MQREEEVVYLYLDDIIPNRFQPREVFEERPLKELAVSIKEHGVIQPIIVRKVNDKYEIIAGERRYKASALAGLTKIPAIVRNLDDKESSKVALLENLQRKNLNPIEEAKTYQKILELDQMTQEELAKTMGKSQSAVSNKLRLLALPEEIQEALLKENISERHARSLLNLKTAEEQKEMMKKVIDNKMSVRQLEEEIKGNSNENGVVEAMKETDELLSIPSVKDIPTAENFIPINPLMPNFNGENTDATTPILTNIPSISEEEINKQTNEEPKFINFGDIKKENSYDYDSDDENDEELFDSSINLEEIKNNATDINTPSINQNGQGLDSLLNIGAFTSEKEEQKDSEFKFFSPAREAIRDSEEHKEENRKEDYFEAPDLISIDLPDSIQTNNINSVALDNENKVYRSPGENKKTINNINDAIEILRNSIKQIENMGLKIEKDEMSLEKSYQIIIKIEK